MKFIRKLYWIAIVVLLAAGFPYEGTGEFITTLSYYVFFGLIFLYAAPKVLGIGSSVCRGRSRAGGFRRSVIGGLQNSASQAVTGFMMGGGRSSGPSEAYLRQQEKKQQAYARWQEAEQREFTRGRLKKEAGFQEYQARRYAGTNFGSQAANRAQDARNKARNL